MPSVAREGRKAFEAGQHLSDNPYGLNSNEWADWMDGYDQAAVDAAHERARQPETLENVSGC